MFGMYINLPYFSEYLLCTYYKIPSSLNLIQFFKSYHDHPIATWDFHITRQIFFTINS